jgi:hypothetical protein
MYAHARRSTELREALLPGSAIIDFADAPIGPYGDRSAWVATVPADIGPPLVVRTASPAAKLETSVVQTPFGRALTSPHTFYLFVDTKGWRGLDLRLRYGLSSKPSPPLRPTVALVPTRKGGIGWQPSGPNAHMVHLAGTEAGFVGTFVGAGNERTWMQAYDFLHPFTAALPTDGKPVDIRALVWGDRLVVEMPDGTLRGWQHPRIREGWGGTAFAEVWNPPTDPAYARSARLYRFEARELQNPQAEPAVWRAAYALTGGDGADRLDGYAGKDVAAGGPGDDVISTGAGDDMLAGGPGRNLLDGGPGTDTAVFAAAASSYRPAGQGQIASADGREVTKLIGIEWLRFGNAPPVRAETWVRQ